MRYDNEIKQKLRDIRAEIDDIFEFPNPCAYTDRMVENVVGTAREVERLYFRNF